MDQVLQQILGYAKAAWYRRWWGVAVAWLVCIVGWTWVIMIPDRYEASARHLSRKEHLYWHDPSCS